jgi:phosphoribosyl 1,2-cyclic phosphodiesterase
VILDAGTGIRNLGLELAEAIQEGRDGSGLDLFLSHTHWDHIQGLPFFQPAYMKGVRLTIHGSPKKGRFLKSVLSGQMDLDYFPVAMSELSADLNIREISRSEIRVGEMLVEWEEQLFHPGGSVRYCLTAGGKRLVYATDVELDRVVRPDRGSGPNDGDLREYLHFIGGADLLIADGQYTEEEYPSKTGWGHSSIPVIIALAKQAGVKQLAVFHHDPQHPDALLDALWRDHQKNDSEQEPATHIFWAREGMTIAL